MCRYIMQLENHEYVIHERDIKSLHGFQTEKKKETMSQAGSSHLQGEVNQDEHASNSEP